MLATIAMWLNASPMLKRAATHTRYTARKLRAVAHHEAGHAVIAHLMGIPFKSILVDHQPFTDEFGRPALGTIIFDREWPDWAIPCKPSFDRKRARDYAARDVRMTLAGPLAETLFTRCWQDLPMNEGDDEFMAFEVAELLYSQRKTQHQWVNRLRFQTLELLMRPDVWAAVEALATALVQHQMLNARQACHVIRQSRTSAAILASASRPTG